MSVEHSMKVSTEHLRRTAYLYVRQSTLRQVVEHSESTQRQYDLRQRAIALGWPGERIVVLDGDQGRSGASAAGREAFQQLLAEVGMGRAGIVMGLEVSRLARNNADWHRLLEICALSETLILDEEGLYDPAHFNDRLLLGLKGAMSEAELHMLRSRLRGGLLNKARRGELRVPLPVGFVYDAAGRVVLDPDTQVQESIRLFFATFRRTGSAYATVGYLGREGLPFPRRLRTGPCKDELIWGGLRYQRALELLRNPRYAGAFAFGRRQQRMGHDGRRTSVKVPRERWTALTLSAHTGYISWEEYEENLTRVRDNALATGSEHRRCPPREGPALLQGLVLCGRCGAGMTVRYHVRRGRLSPEYVCQRQAEKEAKPKCQSIPAAGIDEAIGELLVELVAPAAVEVALAVAQELSSRLEDADRLRLRQVERARFEAELARRRFMAVDPNHRLVADTLEAEWNETLRTLLKAEEDYERGRDADRKVLNEETRARVLALTADFSRVWRDSRTPDRERKRMVRLLVEDATLLKGDVITVHVRFRGGATRTLSLPKAKASWEQWQTDAAVVAEIDHLLDHHTCAHIAQLLNRQSVLSGQGKAFDGRRVARLARAYGLASRYERVRRLGMLTAKELAEKLGIHPGTVRRWRAEGRLQGQLVDDTPQHLYEDPGSTALVAAPRSGRPQEVQYGR